MYIHVRNLVSVVCTLFREKAFVLALSWYVIVTFLWIRLCLETQRSGCYAVRLHGNLRVVSLQWETLCDCVFMMSFLFSMSPLRSTPKHIKTAPLLTSWSNNTQTLIWNSETFRTTTFCPSVRAENWFGAIYIFVRTTAIDFHDYVLPGWSPPTLIQDWQGYNQGFSLH